MVTRLIVQQVIDLVFHYEQADSDIEEEVSEQKDNTEEN